METDWGIADYLADGQYTSHDSIIWLSSVIPILIVWWTETELRESVILARTCRRPCVMPTNTLINQIQRHVSYVWLHGVIATIRVYIYIYGPNNLNMHCSEQPWNNSVRKPVSNAYKQCIHRTAWCKHSQQWIFNVKVHTHTHTQTKV